MSLVTIAEVQIWKSDLALRTPYRIAGENITVAENVFVLLTSSNGLTGLGAGCPMPEVTGETLDYTVATLEGLAPQIGNLQISGPEDWRSICGSVAEDAPAARAALDIAMHDLFCKTLGIPCVRLWGQCHYELPTSVTIGITDQALAKEQLRTHLRNGFRHIKLKIGDDVERDIEMVHRLREWGGSTFELRVDANQGYSPRTLEEFMRGTAKAQIALIEQPFKAGSLDAIRALTDDMRLICMADEDLVSYEDAMSLSVDTYYGVWNIKLMKSGGMTPAKQIADIARDTGIRLMWGCNDESCVSIAAALHVAFACPATAWLDLDGSFDISDDIAEGGFDVRDGMMRLTEKSGLGVSLRNIP